MTPIVGTYRPQGLDTIEKETVFNLETLTKGIYSSPATVQYPHSFIEAASVYASPIIQKRIVPTPENGMRLIYQISFLISPGALWDAGGIWNHALPLANNSSIPV